MNNERSGTLLLVAFGVMCGVMSAGGLWFFLFKTFPERDTFQVVEGDLVVDSVKVGERLSFRIEGYERELFLTHPEERVPEVAAALEGARRLRVHVDPWERNAARSSVIELAAISPAGGREPLITYEDRLAWELTNNRLGGGMGAFFGVFTLAILLILRGRLVEEGELALPATGQISQHFYVSWPKALVVVSLCAGMSALFAWGVTQYEREPLLAVLSVPMGLLFLGTTLTLLTWLRPGRAQLVIDEAGIVDGQLGFGRIPWDRIEGVTLRQESGLDYLCVSVADEPVLLGRSSCLMRLAAWGNRLMGFPSISICLFPIAATTAEVVAIVESHGRSMDLDSSAI